jgi:D-alanyl-D-alanine carboxypeptidase
MNSDRKILLAQIESSLKSLGIPFSLFVERKLPIFQDASELVAIKNNSSGRPYYLIPEAAEAWEKLRDAANCDGVNIAIVSAYRSFQRQFEIVKSKIEKGMSPEVVFSVNAPPGCSEHHTGRAVDIGTPNCIPLDKSFDETAAFSWLQSNARQFGFELSYPPSNLFGFEYEPWHWCYQRNLA